MLFIEVLQVFYILIHIAPAMQYIPSSYDFSNEYGQNCRALQHVFYQGDCGACSAFAAATSVGMRGCKKGMNVVPSPHRLFDCTNAACNTGTRFYDISLAFSHGVPDVLYTTANFGKGCVGGNISSKYYTTVCGSRLVKHHILKHGPMVMGVSVTDEFVHYNNSENIISRPFWGFEDMHAIAVFGWDDGDEHTDANWLIQNSWSEQWGSNGVGRVQMNMWDCMTGFEL